MQKNLQNCSFIFRDPQHISHNRKAFFPHWKTYSELSFPTVQKNYTQTTSSRVYRLIFQVCDPTIKSFKFYCYFHQRKNNTMTTRDSTSCGQSTMEPSRSFSNYCVKGFFTQNSNKSVSILLLPIKKLEMAERGAISSFHLRGIYNKQHFFLKIWFLSFGI